MLFIVRSFLSALLSVEAIMRTRRVMGLVYLFVRRLEALRTLQGAL